ncbi:MAG: radical SAM/SPASM domain-containing protein [Desulfobacula sp.]|jgi:MoaA/NifB/PqqE/SkfB family radical SAM enzyme
MILAKGITQYGFQGRLKAEFPSQIIVDATEVCNLSCIHCPHSEFKRSGNYGARYLDVKLHHKMVDEVREYGQGNTQYIRYTSNGEPLIHPYIYDMLDYAVKRSNVFVTLTTNGTIMNQKRIESLLESGLHMVDISIDAFLPETYAKIRRGGNLKITRANVLKLIEIRKQIGATTKIVVSFIEQSQNKNEAKEFENYWEKQGVDFVVIRRLHSAAGGVAVIAKDMKINQQSEIRKPCLYPWERILLSPKGELAFCPQDWVHGSVLADYHTTTIRQVWLGYSYQQLRSAHLTNDFKLFPFCAQCPDWAQTRWPGDGKSYADLVSHFFKE